jgi:hypothetical protein
MPGKLYLGFGTMNGNGFTDIFAQYLICHNRRPTLVSLAQIIAIGATHIARCAYWFYDYGVMTIV